MVILLQMSKTMKHCHNTLQEFGITMVTSKNHEIIIKMVNEKANHTTFLCYAFNRNKNMF